MTYQGFDCEYPLEMHVRPFSKFKLNARLALRQLEAGDGATGDGAGEVAGSAGGAGFAEEEGGVGGSEVAGGGGGGGGAAAAAEVRVAPGEEEAGGDRGGGAATTSPSEGVEAAGGYPQGVDAEHEGTCAVTEAEVDTGGEPEP